MGIAYWASLGWESLAIKWSSISVYAPGCAPRRRSTMRAGPAPEPRDGVITWRAAAIGGRVEIVPTQPPIDARLYESVRGGVVWSCVAPAARVSMELTGEEPLHGPGYAEWLTLTMPPWHLPITELRWGRWHDAGARRSVVWIDWRGETPRTWAFVDGVAARTASVSESEIVADDLSLTLSRPRTLHEHALGDVLRDVPPLTGLVPRAFQTYRESKWVSAGVLEAPNGPPVGGQAIHELVRLA